MTAENLKAGLAAAQRRDWQNAYQLLSPLAEEGQLSAAETEQLAEAAFWSNRVRESLRLRERAFTAYGRDAEVLASVRAARQIAWGYVMLGSHAVSGGWFAKVRRLLADLPECGEHGQLANSQAHLDIGRGDLEAALNNAREAYAIGERIGDADLQAAALNTQGSVLIRLGDVAEGTAAMDESMASAIAGGLAPFTTASIYCTTISACQRIGDLRRASEWTDAAEYCAAHTGLKDFPGDCRAHRVSILRVSGGWDEAQKVADLVTALEGAEPSHIATVHQELGEMNLCRGRLEAAEEAFRAAEALGRVPQPGRALLCLAKGEVEAAATFIRTALNDQTWDRLARARLLPAQVQIALAAGRGSEALRGAEELRGIADAYQTIALEATAGHAEGLVALSGGELDAAITSLREAMRRWLDLPAPFEAARARLALAEALHAAGGIDDAEAEGRAALSVFQSLDAGPDIERASALLGELAQAKSRRSGGASRVGRAFMFTDIVSSTSLLEAIGDDAWRNLVRWHDRALRARFAAHRGEEIDHAGDGFFTAFESADAALDCAVDIQRELEAHRREHGFSPSVRIGVHVAEATSDSEGYSGLGVHHAARIGAEAQGGEVLVSQATLDAASGKHETSDARSVQLKGFAEPSTVVSLVW